MVVGDEHTDRTAPWHGSTARSAARLGCSCHEQQARAWEQDPPSGVAKQLDVGRRTRRHPSSTDSMTTPRPIERGVVSGHGMEADYLGWTVTVTWLFAGWVSVPIIATDAVFANTPAMVGFAGSVTFDCWPTARLPMSQ